MFEQAGKTKIWLEKINRKIRINILDSTLKSL